MKKIAYFMLLFTMLAVAGCSSPATNQPAVVPSPVVLVVTPTGSSAQVNSPQPTAETINVVSPAQQTGTEQATLDVEKGLVEIMNPGDGDYSPLTASSKVGAGTTIRTGSDGQATLTFMDNTETTVFPNTVVVVEDFAQNTDGSYKINLIQLIGETFNRVNFNDGGKSSFETTTPYGVASVRGTGYWVSVEIVGPLSQQLKSQDLTSFENLLSTSVSGGNYAALVNAIVQLLKTTPGSACVDVASGTVIFTDNGGNTVSIKVDQSACTGTNSAGQNIRVTVTVIDRYCGDNSCDPYLGETSLTCAADC